MKNSFQGKGSRMFWGVLITLPFAAFSLFFRTHNVQEVMAVVFWVVAYIIYAGIIFES